MKEKCEQEQGNITYVGINLHEMHISQSPRITDMSIHAPSKHVLVVLFQLCAVAYRMVFNCTVN